MTASAETRAARQQLSPIQGAQATFKRRIRCFAQIIDSHPDFRPRAWLDELPPLDSFGTLVFQVAGQQLSSLRPGRSSRMYGSDSEAHAVGGRAPRADPQLLRDSASRSKGPDVARVAQRFVDGRLSDEAFSR